MKENKNKIIINLVIYIFIFTIIICSVAIVTNYFYSNIKNMNELLEINSDYNRLNLYLLKITKEENVTIGNYGLVDNDDTSSYYITFEKSDGATNTFIKIGDIIYFNKIKLCENVEIFKVIVDKSQKESILLEVRIDGKTFNSQYTL